MQFINCKKIKLLLIYVLNCMIILIGVIIILLAIIMYKLVQLNTAMNTVSASGTTPIVTPVVAPVATPVVTPVATPTPINPQIGTAPLPTTVTAPLPAPAPVPTINYLGCYKDTYTRAVPTQAGSGVMTIDTCANIARSAGSKYIGMQWPEGYNVPNSAVCFHSPSATYSMYGPATVCNVKDNKGRNLGGYWANAVYSV